MSEHKHTDECLAYAAKTGKPFCIAECKDSYEADNAALKRIYKRIQEADHPLLELPNAMTVAMAEMTALLKE